MLLVTKMSDPERKLLQKRLKYRGLKFEVFEIHVQVEQQILVREIVERPDGVVAVPVDLQHNVYLVSEYCAGPNSFILSLPGGEGRGTTEDDLAEEARRELREETGLSAKRIIKLRFAYEHPSWTTRRSHVFMAYDLFPNPLPKDEEEIIKLVKMPIDDAIRIVSADFASDVSTIGNLLMAREKLRELGL